MKKVFMILAVAAMVGALPSCNSEEKSGKKEEKSGSADNAIVNKAIYFAEKIYRAEKEADYRAMDRLEDKIDEYEESLNKADSELFDEVVEAYYDWLRHTDKGIKPERKAPRKPEPKVKKKVDISAIEAKATEYAKNLFAAMNEEGMPNWGKVTEEVNAYKNTLSKEELQEFSYKFDAELQKLCNN